MINKFKLWKIIILVISLLYILKEGCIFRNLIGVPCPGCGLTRAWIGFFNGDFKSALIWHPLFILVGVVLLLIIILVISNSSRIKNNAIRLIFIIGILFIGVYIIRLIKYFPYISPLEF